MNWVKQDEGWFTAEGVGGVAKYTDGWRFFPAWGPDTFENSKGPYSRLSYAKSVAEQAASRRALEDGK